MLFVIDPNRAYAGQLLRFMIPKMPEEPVYYTIAGYWKQMGRPLTRQEAAALGKKATLVCKALGVVKRTVDDERYRSVGSYPVNVLKMVYEGEENA